MGLLVLGYLLVPIALIYMVRNYKSTNWLWAGFLVASIFIGIAPFVAIAYLITLFLSSRSTKRKGDANAKVVKSYNTDGSYVVYDASSVKSDVYKRQRQDWARPVPCRLWTAHGPG